MYLSYSYGQKNLVFAYAKTKAQFSCPVTAQLISFWFGLMLNVAVNNFSVILRRSHRFLGVTSTFLGVNMSCSRTQHGDPSRAQTPDLWIRSLRCKPPGHRAPAADQCLCFRYLDTTIPLLPKSEISSL